MRSSPWILGCLVPFDDRVRRNDGQRIAPAWPQSVQYEPEKAVSLFWPWLLPGSLIHGQLLPQGQDFNGLMNVETAGRQDKTEPFDES